jgi:predicted phage terminase large subunit-like protein
VLNFPAIAEDPIPSYDPRKIGDPLWPDRYPLTHLKKVRASSEYDWASLYQQRPHNDAFSLFNPDLMSKVEPATIDLTKCKFFGSLDPSEGGADYAAIATLAVLPDGRWLVWDCDLSFDPQSRSLQKIVEKHRQFNYSSFIIEQNSLGHAKSAPGDPIFIIELRKEQAKYNVAIPFKLVWNTQNKADRIRSLQTHYANGQLCFREDWPNVYPELINQMRLVPDPTSHDDGPDSLEMTVSGILNIKKKFHISTQSSAIGGRIL